MSKTYRIDTPVGPMARWLPSPEAAKELYATDIAEAWARDEHGIPAVAFETSTEDEDGDPRPEYTRCLIDGRWDSSISVERPDWPSFDFAYGASPELAMQVTDSAIDCAHKRLICSNTCTPREGIPEPRIRCASCGTTWEPER